MKSNEEISAEVAKLSTMKPTVKTASIFGDNHHDAIDAQIEVLENRMDADEIYNKYGDEDSEGYAENVLTEALAAQNWMFGGRNDPPSENWQSLVI